MNTIEKINDTICTCTLCELHKTRNQAVPGEGATNATIMIIGEGPGEENDKTGRPFVGRGGQILDKFLLKVGLNREELFLTNIIKCRMPHNATPTNNVVEKCIGYLDQQIELINPKIIVTLGLSAAKEILKNKKLKLSDMKNQTFNLGNTKVLCTYHPSSIRYNKDASNEIINTLIRAKALGTL
ncbi:MAG: uracil-DNA glycosylase [Clostridia bacterium]|nr:uracil-DNA glycosylase [Clostridia bacterium]